MKPRQVIEYSNTHLFEYLIYNRGYRAVRIYRKDPMELKRCEVWLGDMPVLDGTWEQVKRYCFRESKKKKRRKKKIKFRYICKAKQQELDELPF